MESGTIRSALSCEQWASCQTEQKINNKWQTVILGTNGRFQSTVVAILSDHYSNLIEHLLVVLRFANWTDNRNMPVYLEVRNIQQALEIIRRNEKSNSNTGCP